MHTNDSRTRDSSKREELATKASGLKDTQDSERLDRLARMRQVTSQRKEGVRGLPRGDTDVAKLVRTRLLPEETLRLQSVSAVIACAWGVARGAARAGSRREHMS